MWAAAPGSLRLAVIRGLLKAVMRLNFRMLQGRPFREQRASIDSNSARFFRFPPGIRVEALLAGGVPSDLVTPAGHDAGRMIMYLHGGGYTTGSPVSHRDLIGRIAQACRAQVLALNYRLAPEHPFPAALEDAQSAYFWLIEQGHDPRRIALAGDSAGGGLLLALLVTLRDSGQPRPAAAVCISPWTDLAFTGASVASQAAEDPMLSVAMLQPMAEAYLAGQDARLPLASPLYADLHNLPPLMIQVGEHEILRDDAVRLAERARAQGVDIRLTEADGLWHVWHVCAPFLLEARDAIAALGRFVIEQTC
jgi:monoterpene epsilon-lactone hydrolase